jgi:dTDP-3-amino-3,4,6-trideoxy-alpha-D-glucose transaminase
VAIPRASSVVPVVNLRPALAASRPVWQARLNALLERAHFVLGEEVAGFESTFASYLGATHCVGVGSGTSAIEISLRDAGVRGEVLTSALTAPFTAVGILAAGASVRFADVDPETLQMDPDSAGNRLTKRTAAIVPVHLYGQPCAIDRFAALAKQRRLKMIQDACQAHGARFAGKPLTAFSDYVCYSFYPTKNLGCLGDGGVIVTNRATIDRRLRQWRDGGRKNGQVSLVPGVNSRLDEIQACFLRVFLNHLTEWNRQRAEIAALYDEALAGCSAIHPVRRDADSVHHLYVIRVPRRERLQRYLTGLGIGTGIHYSAPLHLHPAFAAAKQKKGDLPHAEKACREILSLPIWPGLAHSEVLRVAEAIRRFYA